MITGYAYTAMLVTGCLHVVLGFSALITSIAGMAATSISRTYCGVAFFISIWILLVGALGIAAGVQRLADDKIRQLKTAYMVIAILSACVFCLAGWWMFGLTVKYNISYNYYQATRSIVIIGYVGQVIISLEFILAIVSSSICCCCSVSSPATTVIVQAHPTQVVSTTQYQLPPNTAMQYQLPPNTAMQYQLPPNTAVQYQLPPNTTMQYQPMAQGMMPHQPPAYPTGDYQTQAYPTKAYEPQ